MKTTHRGDCPEQRRCSVWMDRQRDIVTTTRTSNNHDIHNPKQTNKGRHARYTRSNIPLSQRHSPFILSFQAVPTFPVVHLFSVHWESAQNYPHLLESSSLFFHNTVSLLSLESSPRALLKYVWATRGEWVNADSVDHLFSLTPVLLTLRQPPFVVEKNTLIKISDLHLHSIFPFVIFLFFSLLLSVKSVLPTSSSPQFSAPLPLSCVLLFVLSRSLSPSLCHSLSISLSFHSLVEKQNPTQPVCGMPKPCCFVPLCVCVCLCVPLCVCLWLRVVGFADTHGVFWWVCLILRGSGSSQESQIGLFMCNNSFSINSWCATEVPISNLYTYFE